MCNSQPLPRLRPDHAQRLCGNRQQSRNGQLEFHGGNAVFCTSTTTSVRRLFSLSSSTDSRFEAAERAGDLRLIAQVTGGSVMTLNIPAANVRDNQWHHLAATRLPRWRPGVLQ